jgi:hypothetical protein
MPALCGTRHTWRRRSSLPTARVTDSALYHALHGDGEPLLLIPGLATDVSEYQGVIAALARSVLVIALDNRGAGRTDKTEIPYSIVLLADAAAGLLAALSRTRARELGTSMGGQVALALRIPTGSRAWSWMQWAQRYPSPGKRARIEHARLASFPTGHRSSSCSLLRILSRSPMRSPRSCGRGQLCTKSLGAQADRASVAPRCRSRRTRVSSKPTYRA